MVFSPAGPAILIWALSLRGKRIDEDTAQKAGEIALDGAKPLKDNGTRSGWLNLWFKGRC
jgi:hypothetical protein